MTTIYEGNDRSNAQFIRACVKSLGHQIPNQWTDEQVVEFFNSISADQIVTDLEKADMKYQAQIAE